MDLLIEILKSILFGIVEGITEWLPVSSTGHMLLLSQFVTLNVSKDFWDMFLVVIQLGAILAVVILFFSKLNPLSRTKDAAERTNTWKLWAKIVVACVPAAVVGIPLDNWMEEHLGGPFVIAGALCKGTVGTGRESRGGSACWEGGCIGSLSSQAHGSAQHT